MSSNSPSETPKPTPGPDPLDLLPEGLDVSEMGLIPTSLARHPVVQDNPTRRARQFLREANELKGLVAEGMDDPETRERLRNVIPTLAKIARLNQTKRVRIQASKEIREWVKLFEGVPEKSSSGGMTIQGGNVQINLNAGDEGPITSLTVTPEE